MHTFIYKENNLGFRIGQDDFIKKFFYLCKHLLSTSINIIKIKT